MKIRNLVLAVALSAAGISTFSHGAVFSLETSKQSVELKQAPQKIAVYDLSILDTLNALSIEAQLVPQSAFQGNLNKYTQNKFIKAGTLFEPDMDILKQQKPDLILIGGRSAKNLEKLQSVAPTVDLTPDTTHYMDDLKKRTQLLAKAFKREKLADQKLKQVEKLQTTLKSKTQGKTAVMLFAVGENFMPHAANDRFGSVYELSGLASVLPLTEKTDAPRPEAGSPEAQALQQKNLETLKLAASKQPDYIIVLDRGAVNTQKYDSKQNILKNEVLAQTSAVKNGKVIFVNADAWYLTGAGLDNTAYMLNELIQNIK